MHKLQGGRNSVPFCFAGNSLDHRSIEKLSELGISVLTLPPDNDLPELLKMHADLSVFAIAGELILRKDYYEKNMLYSIFEELNVKPILSDSKAGINYPDDCGLCAKLAGSNLICNPAITASEILELAEANRFRIIPVRQGYCACSCVSLFDGAIITSDPGISRVLKEDGYPFLRIVPGFIKLSGYGDGNQGFIGGCSGLFGNTLFFNGNLSLHPDAKAIISFCSDHETEVVSLHNAPLEDCGGIVFTNLK